MSNFYFSNQHPQSHSNLHSSHHGRSRRATRASGNQHQQHQKQMRAMRMQKEQEESLLERTMQFRREFDAARSFDFEDDDLFCPFNLMTDDDLSSMHSGSDRSSLSSGSPDQSPVTQQIQPAQAYLLPPSSVQSFYPSAQKVAHQSMVQQRTGAKAIPIVDPSTKNVASPPPSVSPSRQMLQQAQQFMPRRAW